MPISVVEILKKLLPIIGVLFLPGMALAAANSLCRENLPFGTPSANGPTTAVCHSGYAAAVDNQALVPRWVAYRLTGEHSLGCFQRQDDFHEEEQLAGRRRQEPSDYRGSGYDRGHLAPAEDFAWSQSQLSDSFSMANMAPQLPTLNRHGWEYLEDAVRAWALARGELVIYVGPVLDANRNSIGNDEVSVPIGFWKVIIDPSRHETLAFMMPQSAVPSGSLGRWEVSIAQIEAASGVSLNLPWWVDRNREPAIWKVSIAGWRKQKAIACAGK